MTKIFIVLSILILPILGRAQVLDESLVSAIGLESFSFSKLVNSQEEKRQSRFIASDPNLAKPKKQKTKSVKDRAFDLITDKGVNLDIDNNGKDDFWRVYDKGRLAGIKIDANEDGFIDTYTKYNREGWVELEKLNRNFDKAYDVLRKCKAATDCITLIDGDYDGFYEKKQVEKPIDEARIKKVTYVRTKSNKKWRKVKTRTNRSFQANEASVVHDCEGNCLSDISTNFGSVKEIENALRRSSSRTTSVRFTSTLRSGKEAVNTYDHIDDVGILVNQNCYDVIDKDKLIAQIKDALSSFLGCIGQAKGEFLDSKNSARDSGEKNKYENLANALQTNVAGGLLGLLSENEIGKKVKISCTGMKKGSRFKAYHSSRPDEAIGMATSGGSMYAVQNGVVEITGTKSERTLNNSILIFDQNYLYNNKDGSRGTIPRNKFTQSFVHELMHLIAGDVHGEHEAAIACSSMCELTTSKDFASDSSKYICALSKEEAENADLIGGNYEYIRHLNNMFNSIDGGASRSPYSGVLHGNNQLRYVQNFLNRYSPELFEEIKKDESELEKLYIFPFIDFFPDEEPNFDNVDSGNPIVDYGYSSSKVDDLHRYIVSRVFAGDDLEKVKMDLRKNGLPELKSSNRSSAAEQGADFFLWLLLAN